MTKQAKHVKEKTAAGKILVSVPYDRGFHFFSAVGFYTGETAINLQNFCEQLNKAELEVIRFHFGMGDFQKWIGQTLGDGELARRIDELGSDFSDEALRSRLVVLVEGRLSELQALV
jgi:alpha-amylase